jgi:hypothetical protein
MKTPSPVANGVSDRRIAPRYQPAFGTVCRIGPNTKTKPALIGLVWNISETGVSMLVGKPPKAGAEVPGELSLEAGGGGVSIALRVVHIRPMKTGDYIVGAQFERRLAPEELRLFLLPPIPAGKNNGKAATPVKKLPKTGK